MTSWTPPPSLPEAHKKPRKPKATNGQVKPADYLPAPSECLAPVNRKGYPYPCVLPLGHSGRHSLGTPAKPRKPKAAAADPALPVPLKRKVAIVGFAPHNELTPFADDSWEIWGINRLHVVRPGRYDRWFELHDLSDYGDDGHLPWLKQFGGDLFIRSQDIGQYDLPNAKPFPLDALLNAFDPYFTNTISYLVALAILMGYEEIGLWGVDMAQDHLMQMEFGEQRPSVEFYLGIAKGQGIKVTIPEGADLLVTGYLYGFGEPSPFRAKLEWRFQELGARKQQIKNEISGHHQRVVDLTAQLNQLDGAMQDCAYLLRNLMPATDDGGLKFKDDQK